MKHYIHTLITAHFFITATCIAMEKEKTVFPQITAVKNQHQALFLTNNRAVINGADGCSIVDVQNNKEVKQLSNSTWKHLVLNHDKTKVAVYNANAIKIFDAQTGNEEYAINYLKEISSAAFNEHNDIVLACKSSAFDWYYTHAIVYADTKKNLFTERPSSDIHYFFPNTTQKYIYSATCSGSETKIYSYLSDLSDAYNNIKTINNSSCFFESSPNGSLLAVANGNTLYLLDVNNEDYNNNLKCFEEWSDNFFKAMQFHPNNLYIAVLMEYKNSKNIHLRYFNDKAKYITETPITIDQSKKTPAPVHRPRRGAKTYNPASVSFAPNKKFALVTLHNQCFSVPVPFEIVYQDDAKEKAIFAYFIFKNYKTDEYILPKDINQNLVYAVLETLKR